MKKIIAGVLGVIMSVSLINFNTITANAEEYEVLRSARNNIEIKDVITSEYYEKEEEKSKMHYEKDNDLLLHNNGKPLKTDLLVEKNGFDLIAVHKVIDEDFDYSHYYFGVENEEGDITEIKDEINKGS